MFVETAFADQRDGTGFHKLLEASPQTFLQVQDRAVNGDAAAEMVMADAYENGKYGVSQDYTRALYWYRKAADAHNGDAELAIARFYQEGKGVTKDAGDANAWLQMAANDGSAKALDFLGDSYLTGRGVAEDDQKAIGLYKQAAKRDVVQSEVKLGGLYFNGQALPQSYGAAYYWLKIAQSNPDSGQFPELNQAVVAARDKIEPDQRRAIDGKVQAIVAMLRPQAQCPSCIEIRPATR